MFGYFDKVSKLVKLVFYSLNSIMVDMDDMESVLCKHNLHGPTVEGLNCIVSKISKRNKVIKIADHSFTIPKQTFAKYEDDPLSRDLEDSTKILQVENRALAKSKSKILLTLSSKPNRSYSPQLRNEGFKHRFNPPPPSVLSSSHRSNQIMHHLSKSKKKSPNQQKNIV